MKINERKEENMTKKNLIFSVVWVILGAVLFMCSYNNMIDQFWSGFGGGIFVVGILQLIKQVRYWRNEEYRKNFDINCTDERNQFVKRKAWASAACSYILIAAIGIVILKVLGKDLFISVIATSIGTLMILFWIFYLYYKAKN